MDTAFHDDFESGQTDIFYVEVLSVGEIIALDVEIHCTLLSKEWFLDYIEVIDEERIRKFEEEQAAKKKLEEEEAAKGETTEGTPTKTNSKKDKEQPKGIRFPCYRWLTQERPHILLRRAEGT